MKRNQKTAEEEKNAVKWKVKRSNLFEVNCLGKCQSQAIPPPDLLALAVLAAGFSFSMKFAFCSKQRQRRSMENPIKIDTNTKEIVRMNVLPFLLYVLA